MADILSDAEALRYNRQIVLPQIDFDGQERLKQSHVAIIGVGGLGCAAAQYLAASGVGTLTLVDFDIVSLSNLQRQVLHTEARMGQPKVDSAKTALCALNPHVTVNAINADLDDDEFRDVVTRSDVVVDCSDNVATRNRLDVLCQQSQTPLVFGAAIRMEGQLSVFTYQPNTPNYRSISRLFGDNTLSCVEAGVLSPIVGIVGTLQAMETLKLLLNIGEPLVGKLLLIDALNMQFTTLKLP
ncbi:molybdopterin-synthase adenylyltransferase MoeB [Pasteurellaceae bacterium HPA106]|uniref:molybdopterin-synthase adenylyltransferase MoeB n=1 Tax=Spirabiliibacterium pneumoniae TaxID=221400 RepID=UPI001AAD5C22|nr:molybdopterin-synthase adenylyltransferase MoeB [Spirabiliibacterium pneumoniae]MBE2896531.1 molybdopterin-synthase adenylyltransferase MoeB [Spirabiliibacterium pneumoniae]